LAFSLRIATPLMVAGMVALSSASHAQGRPGGPQQQDLPQLLHLRPDQMTAFHAYQQASQPNPDELGRLRGASPQMLARLPTPQRLDRLGAFVATQQAMFRRSADATRAWGQGPQ
jgi:hypothetical protein